jgi:hypothetical protein
MTRFPIAVPSCERPGSTDEVNPVLNVRVYSTSGSDALSVALVLRAVYAL